MIIKNTHLLWRGESLHHSREEIAVVLTGLIIPSANPKTGPLIQTWIVPMGQVPTEAIKSGLDAAVCGDCKLRGRACYVNMAPVNNIQRTVSKLTPVPAEAYEFIKMSKIGLRIGSYGDAAMTPFDAWWPLIQAAPYSVGYTHQWRWCNSIWKRYLQASVETIAEMNEANALGWATFRVKPKGSKVQKNEMICVNQTNKYIKCSNCKLCNGRKNICIDVHGASFKVTAFNKINQQNHSHDAAHIN